MNWNASGAQSFVRAYGYVFFEPCKHHGRYSFHTTLQRSFL